MWGPDSRTQGSAGACVLVALVIGLGFLLAAPSALAESAITVASYGQRGQESAVWDGGGNAYTFGGVLANGTVLGDIQRFTPATGDVTTMASALPVPFFGSAAVWDASTQSALIFGGNTGSACNTARTAIVRYTPSTGTVATLNATLPDALGRLSAARDPLTGNVYLFGGLGANCAPSSAIYRFTPANETVSSVGALPSGRYATSAVWSSTLNAAYVFGGRSNATRYADIVRFTPTTGSVATIGSLPSARHATSAVAEGATAYVFGGVLSNDALTNDIARVTLSSGSAQTSSVHLPLTSFYDPAVWSGRLAYVFGAGSSSGIAAYEPCQGAANDCMGSASALGASASLSTAGFGRQAGEPTPCGLIGATAWYKFTADTNGTLHVDTSGSGYDTVLAVHAGANVESLVTLGCNDDANPQLNLQSVVEVPCTAGTTYWVQLGGWNGANGSAVLNRAGCTLTAPGAPSWSNATGSDAQVSLAWNAPASDGGSPITGYRLYRATPPGNETLYRTLGDVLAFSDVNVTNGQAYLYRLSAENAVGESALSSRVSVTPYGTPSAPSTLQATASNARVNLTWTSPTSTGGSPLLGYKILRGASPGAETPYRTLGVTLAFADTNVSNGVTYHYQVKAYTAIGDGAPRNASATPFTLPGSPQGLVATGSNARVDLAWSAPASDGGAAIHSYNVFRNVSGGAMIFYRNVPSGLAFADVNVTNGFAYNYTVSANNAAGAGPASASASATPRTTPGAPTITSATPGVGRITVNWSAPASNGGATITAYDVHRNGALYRVVGDVRTFADVNLTEGAAYAYEIAAVNVVGEGAKSNVATATAWARPGAPSNLVATTSPGRVNLTWSVPANGGAPITSYTVYRGTVNGSLAGYATLAGTSFSDAGIVGGTRYYYAVSASNAVGEGNRSATVDKVGHFAPAQPNNFVATAGPSAHKVSLSWSAPSSTGGAPPVTYELSRLAGGTYHVLATTNATSYVDADRPNSVQQYRLVAINGVGYRSLELVRTATPWTYPSEPRAFDAMQADVDGGILLTWDRPANEGGGARVVEGYRVEARTEEGNWTLLANLGDQGSYLTDKVRGKGVYLRVAAVNDLGEVGAPSAPDFIRPTYVQNDPGDFGDAGDESQPTPIHLGDANPRTLGTLIPGADSVDAFRITLAAGPGGTVKLCQTIHPSDELDVLLRITRPGGAMFESDEGGAGVSESVCGTGPAGDWLVTVQAVSPASSGGASSVDVPVDPLSAAMPMGVIAPAGSLSYGLESNCTPYPECLFGGTDAREEPACNGCSDPTRVIREAIRTSMVRTPSLSHPAQFYSVHALARNQMESVEARI